MVSILYRTHRGLSASAKVWSLYAFDALARAARHQVNKNHVVADVNAEQGNCATFLLKIQGVLDGLFRDLVISGIKVSTVVVWLTFRTSIYTCPVRAMFTGRPCQEYHERGVGSTLVELLTTYSGHRATSRVGLGISRTTIATVSSQDYDRNRAHAGSITATRLQYVVTDL